MLKPIPACIMRSTATVKACTGVDRYQNPTYSTYEIKKIHIQPTNEVRKTASNTEKTLRSLLFADRRHSTPLDWLGIFNTANQKGGDVKVIVRDQEYTVFSVDELRDNDDQFHHWEIGLL